ncbi:MAG: hypothetical protein ACE365_05440 [Gammaproteobacteria bacterium]
MKSQRSSHRSRRLDDNKDSGAIVSQKLSNEDEYNYFSQLVSNLRNEPDQLKKENMATEIYLGITQAHQRLSYEAANERSRLEDLLSKLKPRDVLLSFYSRFYCTPTEESEESKGDLGHPNMLSKFLTYSLQIIVSQNTPRIYYFSKHFFLLLARMVIENKIQTPISEENIEDILNTADALGACQTLFFANYILDPRFELDNESIRVLWFFEKALRRKFETKINSPISTYAFLQFPRLLPREFERALNTLTKHLRQLLSANDSSTTPQPPISRAENYETYPSYFSVAKDIALEMLRMYYFSPMEELISSFPSSNTESTSEFLEPLVECLCEYGEKISGRYPPHQAVENQVKTTFCGILENTYKLFTKKDANILNEDQIKRLKEAIILYRLQNGLSATMGKPRNGERIFRQCEERLKHSAIELSLLSRAPFLFGSEIFEKVVVISHDVLENEPDVVDQQAILNLMNLSLLNLIESNIRTALDPNEENSTQEEKMEIIEVFQRTLNRLQRMFFNFTTNAHKKEIQDQIETVSDLIHDDLSQEARALIEELLHPSENIKSVSRNALTRKSQKKSNKSKGKGKSNKKTKNASRAKKSKRKQKTRTDHRNSQSEEKESHNDQNRMRNKKASLISRIEESYSNLEKIGGNIVHADLKQIALEELESTYKNVQDKIAERNGRLHFCQNVIGLLNSRTENNLAPDFIRTEFSTITSGIDINFLEALSDDELENINNACNRLIQKLNEQPQENEPLCDEPETEEEEEKLKSEIPTQENNFYHEEILDEQTDETIANEPQKIIQNEDINDVLRTKKEALLDIFFNTSLVLNEISQMFHPENQNLFIHYTQEKYLSLWGQVNYFKDTFIHLSPRSLSAQKEAEDILKNSITEERSNILINLDHIFNELTTLHAQISVCIEKIRDVPTYRTYYYSSSAQQTFYAPPPVSNNNSVWPPMTNQHQMDNYGK